MFQKWESLYSAGVSLEKALNEVIKELIDLRAFTFS